MPVCAPGDTVAQAVAQMKTEIGQWDYCSEYLTIESARRNYCAFPIVSSALDTYPGKGKVDALQEVHSDWQLFGKAKFTVTAVSANTALGTVVPLNDLTFEAKPAENAAVSGWSLQPEGAAAVARDGNVFTVSDVRGDCTLVVEFRQRIPATVVFSTPEGASQPMQRSYVGEEMALTAPEGKPLANAHDYVFAGWTDAPVADAVQVSTVYTDTYTPIRAMVTLYALYSWQDGETTRYTTQPQNKVCPSEAFSDLDVTQWYHEPVDYMLETGMMNGMSATTFEPNGTLTRAQLVTVLYRHAGSPDVTGLPNPVLRTSRRSRGMRRLSSGQPPTASSRARPPRRSPRRTPSPASRSQPFSTATTARPLRETCSPPSRMRTRSPAMPLRPCSGPSAAA